ncbi:MAG: hypothetical protein KIT14_24500 [bacterium]|nr:hypothetical protein [bacterium]
MSDAPPAHPSWTADARSVLDRACERHGGWTRWRALEHVRLGVAVLRGAIPWLKGAGRTFPVPRAVEVAPHARRASFARYPDDAHDGVFADGGVAIRARAGSALVATTPTPRTDAARHWRWTPLDALYFFGYALWHYHTLPFTLAAARLLVRRRAGGHDVLQVAFPPDVPTHSRRQTFWFAADGLLVRHDYHAEVVGRWARGAHLWRRHRDVDGIPIALERHVVPTVGDHTLPFPALHAELDDVAVAFSVGG